MTNLYRIEAPVTDLTAYRSTRLAPTPGHKQADNRPVLLPLAAPVSTTPVLAGPRAQLPDLMA